MDPFEVRMQFLSSLRKLNATQAAIQRAVTFAIKHFAKCGEDLWDCVLEECQKGSLNMRINILYCLDSLCEASVHYQQGAIVVNGEAGKERGKPLSYVEYVSRDLDKIVQLVVPEYRDGLVNLASAKQILENWRSKRVLEPAVVEEVLQMLDRRRESLRSMPASESSRHATEFSRDEILRRFEQDRERHKLLREKRWCLPIPSTPVHQPPKLASALFTPAASPHAHASPASPSSSTLPPPTQIRNHQQHQPTHHNHGPEFSLDV
ncbi:hypothetical protein FRB99_007544, partial [Tulasnella sp. 403]